MSRGESRQVRARGAERPEIAMTPMIDVVFQLLIFFLMTFKPIVHEGQFEVAMSPAGQAVPQQESILPPLTVQLAADENGVLAGIALGNTPLESMAQLTREVQFIATGELASELEVELRADERLRYEYVVAAINALTRAGVRTVNFGPAFRPGQEREEE